MRRPTVTVLALAVAVALTAPALAGAGPDSARQAAANRTQIGPLSHTFPDKPSNDNFAQIVYNHFGNPAAGQALIQGWLRQTYDETAMPAAVQAYGQGVKLAGVKRIAVRVELHTSGGTNDQNLIAPTAANTGDTNRMVTQAGPSANASFGADPVPDFCEAWWAVRYAIRWNDDTITGGKRLVAPADLWNDNCYFIQPPPPTP